MGNEGNENSEISKTIESKKHSLAYERIKEEIKNYDGSTRAQIIVQHENYLNFDVVISNLTGTFYEDAVFTFHFKFSEQYGAEPPKITIKEKVYHPNIGDFLLFFLNNFFSLFIYFSTESVPGAIKFLLSPYLFEN
jgi:hypothetical protein